MDYKQTDMELSGAQAALLDSRLYPADGPVVIKVSGRCPRCKDDIPVWSHPLVVVAGVADLDDSSLDQVAEVAREQGQLRPTGDETVDMECRCAGAHPKQPPGVSVGCGARFAVDVTWP